MTVADARRNQVYMYRLYVVHPKSATTLCGEVCK